MRIADPASKIMKNTSVSENSYSATNNIEGYLKGQLQYSDALWVLTSDNLNSKYDFVRLSGESETFGGKIENVAEAFVKEYYSNNVAYKKGNKVCDINDTKFVDGKVYIMKLSNSDGRIYMADYKFEAQKNDCVLSQVKLTDAGAVDLTGVEVPAQ